jgi:hypothetical protein
MPTWTQCLQVVVLLAITGFALVVVSSFWKILALITLAATLMLWLGRKHR